MALQAAVSREILHLQTGQYGCQMGTKLKVVLCDEHGIGGSGEYFGDNDAHLDIINVFYHEASGGKYLPRAVLFDLEPGVIDAVRACSRIVARLPHTSGNKPRRQNWLVFKWAPRSRSSNFSRTRARSLKGRPPRRTPPPIPPTSPHPPS